MVTGAGSGVGQGVLKALHIAGFPLTVVSADIAPMNVALYRADEAMLIPRVEAAGALETIIERIRSNRIDLVLIGSEFELEFFSLHRDVISRESGAVVIVAPPRTVEIANDKWLTSEFLRENGLPYAESSIPGGVDEAAATAASWGYPLIVKTRSGTSSRHVTIVRNADEVRATWPVTPKPMLQRVVDIPSSELHNEYTCSVFRTARGTVLGPFHARRTLRGGTSWHIEVDRFPNLDDLLLGIGHRLEFPGTLNVQLMMGVSGPVPFEFNARNSGTTAVRAHFGFNEPAMAVQSYFYGEEPEEPTIRKGVAMRYNEEVFIDNVLASELVPNVSKGHVRPWF